MKLIVVVNKAFTLLTGFIVFFLLQSNAGAITSSIPVELVIPDTVVKVSGFAAPNALVTITRNNSVIGTTIADSSGLYSRSFGAQSPGIQNYKFYYKDSENTRSRINSQSISIQPQQETNVTANLSPTITRRTSTEVIKGSIIQINGYSASNSEITLRFAANSKTFSTITTSNGFYEFLIDSNELNEGNYIASVSSILNGVDLSDTSSSVVFDIVSDKKPSTPDIVVRPDQLSPPVPLSPENGTIINGNTVEISGQSVPNAQINIYENGVIYGSVFADENGIWSFIYTATSSPVTLSFEACLNNRCSVLSKTITLEFSLIKDINCSIDFELQNYRFWNVDVNSEIELSIQNSTDKGVFEVIWGDGVIEYFDYEKDLKNNILRYKYANSGNYNGKITLKESRNDRCGKTRYFSALIVDDGKIGLSTSILWLLLLIAGLLSLNYIAGKDKQSTIQK